jgi:hypothetical protein
MKPEIIRFMEGSTFGGDGGAGKGKHVKGRRRLSLGMFSILVGLKRPVRKSGGWGITIQKWEQSSIPLEKVAWGKQKYLKAVPSPAQTDGG